jgi:hypothetical protein
MPNFTRKILKDFQGESRVTNAVIKAWENTRTP